MFPDYPELWLYLWTLFVTKGVSLPVLIVLYYMLLLSPDASVSDWRVNDSPVANLPINIDFDAASKAWRKDTLADNPTALRAKQKAYWAAMEKKYPRRRRAKTPRRVSRCV